MAVGLCAFFGLLGAYSIASEPIAYVASMFYGIYFLYLLIPAVVILFVASIVAATFQKTKYAATLFLSCLMLSTFFIGGFQAMRALGWARYETNGSNEMRPLDYDLTNRIVLAIKKGASQEEIRRFDEDILRKKIYHANGDLDLLFADGVCNFSYPNTVPGVTIITVPFCKDATDEQKVQIRDRIISSPLVYAAFEDTDSGEVKKLK